MSHLLDNVSIKPKLLIFGNERFASKTGTFMSILSLITVIVFVIYFFVTYFERRDLNVIYYKNQGNFIADVNLNNTYLMYILRDSGYNQIDPKVASIVPWYYKFNNNKLDLQLLQTEPCTWEK